MRRRPRVCMFVEYFYPVVSGGKVPFAGGIEVQLSILARALAARDFDVRVVTCDFGQPEGLVVDGVTLHRCYPPRAGLPVLRFFHPRLTGTISALRRADADLYLFQGAALGAGITRDVTRAMGRRFVWLVGHDHDVMASLPDVHGPRDRAWVRRAIRGADAIVSQTEKQRRMLNEAFGRDSTVIMNPVDIPDRTADVVRQADVVWVGTYKPSPRPEWFRRFGASPPAVRWRMAGGIPVPPLADDGWRAGRGAGARLANLGTRGTIPPERIGAFLLSAGVFAHSSPAEGFPNAFLEAWAHGLPTITAFDPDGIIERERLGAFRTDEAAWGS